MKKKLLIICGPTGSGKTGLALVLAKKFGGEIISADSRQVFTGMDIGTGKDIPSNAKRLTDHVEIDGINLWGYDLTGPKEEFSVSLYTGYAKKIIDEIIKRGHLPIVTGGTGLYIKGLVDGIETTGIAPNRELRQALAGRGVDELFENLAKLDPIKAASLNTSDKKNPRRLIRAIEVSQWKLSWGEIKTKQGKAKYNSLFVGLTAPKYEINKKIAKRIDDRIALGFLAEVESLLAKDIDWEFQSMSSLGYKQLRGYFEKKMTLQEAFDLWKKEEKRYAKRQMTWWKHDKRINWFQINEPGWQKKVEELVNKWYSTYDD